MWKFLCIASILAVLGLPLYLWQTNYCFAELRYVPRSEICAKALASIRPDALTENTKCLFEPSAVSAFLVFPTVTNRTLHPHVQWGDLGRDYDSCGRRLKFR